MLNAMKKTSTIFIVLLIFAILCSGILTACQAEAGVLYPDGTYHLDKDKDGLCDQCAHKMEVTVTLLSVNDLHGKILPGTAPGVEGLTAYIAEQSPNTLLVSVGDMWQGSAISGSTKGDIVNDWMNSVGFDAMTLGNHEFDWGAEYIVSNMMAADFPYLAINVYDNTTHRRADFCQPSTVVELADCKVGVIGAIGDCYSSISQEMVSGYTFLTGDRLTELVANEARILREEQGVDAVVYCLHDGYGRDTAYPTSVDKYDIASYYQMTLSDVVDVVVEGHSHHSYILRDSNGVYHVQSGSDGECISSISLSIHHATHSVDVTPSVIEATDFSSKKSAEYNALIAGYETQFAQLTRPIAQVAHAYNSDQLRDLVCRAYCEAGTERWGKEYDVFLAGGYISVRAPYSLESGLLTYNMLYDLFPFDNRIALASIKGSDLRRVFLESDNRNYGYCLADYGEAMLDSIRADFTYYVVTDTYSLYYAPNRLSLVRWYDEDVYARDLLARLFADDVD